MKRCHYRAGAVLLAGAIAALAVAADLRSKPGNPSPERWRSGDVVFFTGTTWRSYVVRVLEGYSTDYSHVGIIVMKDGVPYVIHADPASDRVVMQPWETVVRSNVSGGAVYRVRGAAAAAVEKSCATAEEFAAAGVPFDHGFDLQTSDRIFCTELVLRSYRSAGIDLAVDAETKHPHLLPSTLLESGRFEEICRF